MGLEDIDLNSPVLLANDNFTPLTRTPWAGSEITRTYKKTLLPDRVGERVGESWEFSCDPGFPSRVLGEDFTLAELVAKRSVDVLGLPGGKCELLVKLLNASQPLSLQVHPKDDDEGLAEGECGKPESWLVLAAEKGAGLYLGFNRALSRDELSRLLRDGDRAKEVLQFVPVSPGDFFEIEPGVPHAIGPGVTLLEPQRIQFGKSGKTYRLWDWGRLYDDEGLLDPEGGSPRELHLDAGLRLVDPQNQVGEGFVGKTRRQATVRSAWQDRLQIRSYPSNGHYQVSVVEASQAAEGSFASLGLEKACYCALVLQGACEIGGKKLFAGQSALLSFAVDQKSLSAVFFAGKESSDVTVLVLVRVVTNELDHNPTG